MTRTWTLKNCSEDLTQLHGTLGDVLTKAFDLCITTHTRIRIWHGGTHVATQTLVGVAFIHPAYKLEAYGPQNNH